MNLKCHFKENEINPSIFRIELSYYLIVLFEGNKEEKKIKHRYNIIQEDVSTITNSQVSQNGFRKNIIKVGSFLYQCHTI